MFGGIFGRLPFDRPFTTDALFIVSIESLTEVTPRINVDMPVTVIYESQTEFTPEMTREITQAAVIETATETLTQMVREMLRSAMIESVTEFNVTVTQSHVNVVNYSGAFAPGDRIIIDTRKQTITLNGVNVLHLFEGDFFDLAYGLNTITYKDAETGRNILTRIMHRDRYLY
ncbi:phage distal tail protein [Paenibacillus sp.]|uniref:phage distal tail protein n=1 Tax=Paenibacillus sp. TaxID=58172 RepID=UPI0028A92C72|nr:phage tail domain-containing protein [Paenibacillus sp.]